LTISEERDNRCLLTTYTVLLRVGHFILYILDGVTLITI